MKRILTAALALSLLSGSAAMAAPHNNNGHDNGYSQGRDDRRDNDNRYDNNRHDNGNHYGQQKHAWKRGERLPVTYYQNRNYYVDYRRAHLRAPPRGYQWVQVDNNYVMVALATGLIASLIAHN
jgi:Ni/Co efflux regulator RcnB